MAGVQQSVSWNYCTAYWPRYVPKEKLVDAGSSGCLELVFVCVGGGIVCYVLCYLSCCMWAGMNVGMLVLSGPTYVGTIEASNYYPVLVAIANHSIH